MSDVADVLSSFLNSPAFLAVALLIAGFFALRVMRSDAAAIHVLVNNRLDLTLDKVEALQAEVEKLGGVRAPPTRAESRDVSGRSSH